MRFLRSIFPIAIAFIASPSMADDLVLPFSFDRHQTPMVELDLSGTTYTLRLDTGSAEGLHLTKETLSRIPEIRFTGGTIRSIDLAGEVRENARFVIDELSVSGRAFQNIGGIEFSPWGVSVRDGSSLPTSQVLGLGFFKGERILIDYAARTLTIFDQNRYLDPSPEEGWVELPFNVTDDGPILDVEIAGESHHMSLDSGATLSMVIAARITDQSAALPCEAIFPDGLGPEDCRLIPVTTKYEGKYQTVYAYMLEEDPFQGRDFDDAFAGLLGGDFLANYAVLIDFADEQLYVRPITQSASE